MPSKRAAHTGSKAALSPAKRQRAESAVTLADPFVEACSSVIKVLRGSLEDTSSAEALCAALPFALRSPQESMAPRHAYQETVLHMTSIQVAGIVAGRRTHIAAAEKEMAELEANRSHDQAIREEVSLRLADRVKSRDEAAEKSRVRKEAVECTLAALEGAKQQAEVAEAQRQCLEQERDEFEAGHAELFLPFKTSAVVGKHWREREKVLARLMPKLKVAGAEASLLAGLPVALKSKADIRSEFAVATVAHAEDLYMQHIESLKAKVEEFSSELSSRHAAVADGEAAAKVAQEALDVAIEEDIIVQNAWVAVTSELFEQDAKLKTHGPKVEQVQLQLMQLRTEADNVQQILDSFEASRPVGAIIKASEGANEVAKPDTETLVSDVRPTVEASGVPVSS